MTIVFMQYLWQALELVDMKLQHFSAIVQERFNIGCIVLKNMGLQDCMIRNVQVGLWDWTKNNLSWWAQTCVNLLEIWDTIRTCGMAGFLAIISKLNIVSGLEFVNANGCSINLGFDVESRALLLQRLIPLFSRNIKNGSPIQKKRHRPMVRG